MPLPTAQSSTPPFLNEWCSHAGMTAYDQFSWGKVPLWLSYSIRWHVYYSNLMTKSFTLQVSQCQQIHAKRITIFSGILQEQSSRMVFRFWHWALKQACAHSVIHVIFHWSTACAEKCSNTSSKSGKKRASWRTQSLRISSYCTSRHDHKPYFLSFFLFSNKNSICLNRTPIDFFLQQTFLHVTKKLKLYIP